MFAIVDARIPKEALRKLENYANVLLFSSSGIVYDAISGHPDIFFCQTPSGLIAAPNTPAGFVKKIEKLGIKCFTGQNSLGNSYPQTAIYNAFFAKDFFVHNIRVSDPVLLGFARNCIIVNVKQGYARCNLIEAGELFISSDESIYGALISAGRKAFYVSPRNTVLPGMQHGFFGGCAGLINNNLFISGSLANLPEGEVLSEKLKERGIGVVELKQGPLFDVGSILFLQTK